MSERYTPNGIPLTDREHEVLVILMEECAEVTQAASKLIRFGKENRPDNGVSNVETLSREVGELTHVLNLARGLGLTHPAIEEQAEVHKRVRLRWYMQSQP